MVSIATSAIIFAACGLSSIANARDKVPSIAESAAPADPDVVRASALVALMTLDEKIAMVNAAFGERAKLARPDETRLGAGHGFGVPRLGIPDLFETDASLGISNGSNGRLDDTATALPASLATGATFDPSLAYRGGAIIGAEARSRGFNILLAGGVNLVRDPWGGRAFEYLGEDAWHSGVMGGAHIAGVQSNRIISTIKHYALNPSESGRTVGNAVIGEAALRESDLLAFEIAIERGRPGAVMCSYNLVNGDYACENERLLNQILKGDWGYTGWVMSDWGAVHSTVKAAMAGLDQESGQELDSEVFFGAPLKAAVLAGKVPQARLDDMVTRIVSSMSRAGLLDDDQSPQSDIYYARHAGIAQRVAEEGTVLLRNENRLLPLQPSVRTIAVIGAHANQGVLAGGGSSAVRSVGGTPVDEVIKGIGPMGSVNRFYHASSPLAAMREQAPGVQLTYASGDNIEEGVKAARDADVVIVFAEQWRTEMIDIDGLSLPGNQNALISAVAKANPQTVVVLETGGPVLMPWLNQVGGVLEAWYPGQRGGTAIARILFGDVNPSGRLPVTFPTSEAQAPRPDPVNIAAVKAAAAESAKKPATDMSQAFVVDMSGGVAPFDIPYKEGADVGYRWYERTKAKPLFPFGFGLSYSSFRYSNLQISSNGSLSVSFDVTNTGDVPGKDVPQVYVSAPSKGTPVWRLVSFQKVELAPGAQRRVVTAIDPRTLASFDVAQNRWVLDKGNLQITVGRFAGDAALSGSLPVPAMQGRP